jgi:hypothetical protein
MGGDPDIQLFNRCPGAADANLQEVPCPEGPSKVEVRPTGQWQKIPLAR